MSFVYNSIKYIGLAIFIFLLIKSLQQSNTISSNDKEIALIAFIIVLNISILSSNNNCPKTEGYKVLQTPLVPSVYEEVNDETEEEENDEGEEEVKNKYEIKVYEDEDIKEMRKMLGISDEKMQKLRDNEQKAADIITSNYQYDMVNTTSHPFNTVPLGTRLYGYTLMPPENWFRAYEKPPVCVTDKPCKICPSEAYGTSSLLRYTNPELVEKNKSDMEYLKKKMNVKKNKVKPIKEKPSV